MQIQRFFIFIVTIAFIFINCNPVFSSDKISVMGEVYHGDDGEMDAFDKGLKSPQDMGNAPVIKLNDDNLKTQQKALSEKEDIDPPQIGFARYIESLSEHKQLKKTLNWIETQDGGHTATIIISSPEAKALRVGIVVKKIPQETEIRFFKIDKDFPTVALVTGGQINKLLLLNKDADPDHPDSQTYWSPSVPGESIGIEIYLPIGIPPDNFDIAIPFLSHIFDFPYDSEQKVSTTQSYGDSSSCQNDISCYSNWVNIGTSVAKMVFTESGDTYNCTGTLLNDTDSSTYRPYFITANHCIGNQSVASTLETHWFYESAWCNGSTRNSNYTTRFGGATLLWTKGTTTYRLDSNQDVTFLELNDTPPAGVTYSGWSTTIDSNTVTGIHHPEGDWKKISFGSQDGNYKCYDDTADDGYHCVPSTNGSFLSVIFSDGGTEGGSSGSGIFQNYSYLVGVLLGGSGECEGSEKDYSKFSAAYSAGNLSQWLDPEPCTYSISPTNGNFTSGSGSKPVSVRASSSSCSWTTSENLSWVSLFPTSGTGSGDVTVFVTANTGAARSGSVTIARKTFTISQDAQETVSEEKRDQAITLSPYPDNLSIGSISYLSATASSGLSVVFSSLITGLELGICNVAADQEGNAIYEPAPTVTHDIAVIKADQIIHFTTYPEDLVLGDTAYLSATASSDLSVAFSSLTPDVCSSRVWNLESVMWRRTRKEMPYTNQRPLLHMISPLQMRFISF